MNEETQLRAAAMELATRVAVNKTNAELVETAEAIYKFLKGQNNE